METANVRWLSGALEALYAADAMDSDEVYDWPNRMLVALGLKALEPPPPGFNGVRTVFIGQGKRPTPLATPPIARFLELIPAIGGDRPVPYGGRFQILGIERYDSKVVVTWRMAPLPNPESKNMPKSSALTIMTPKVFLMMSERYCDEGSRCRSTEPAGHTLTISDDLGTEYLGRGGGWSGGGRTDRTCAVHAWRPRGRVSTDNPHGCPVL